jgi:hypothetical protein
VSAFASPISNAADGENPVKEVAKSNTPIWRHLTTEQRLLVAVNALALGWFSTRGWGRDIANRLQATHNLPPYLKAVFKTLSAKQKRSYFYCFKLETVVRSPFRVDCHLLVLLL